jgi:hypothetical protein
MANLKRYYSSLQAGQGTMILKFSCLTAPAVNTTESGNKCTIPVPGTHYTWNGAITWESIAITCCGNESVTEFVVFFLGLYHTQCCTRQFWCGICRRLLPACRRETTCKGACLALARVVATTDVGRGRLWAPPLRRSDPRSLCPMVWDWAGCTFARVCIQLYSECTPRDSQNPPRYWAFPGVIMNNKSQEAVRTRIWRGRVCESNETKEGPSRARKIVEWTG